MRVGRTDVGSVIMFLSSQNLKNISGTNPCELLVFRPIGFCKYLRVCSGSKFKHFVWKCEKSWCQVIPLMSDIYNDIPICFVWFRINDNPMSLEKKIFLIVVSLQSSKEETRKMTIIPPYWSIKGFGAVVNRECPSKKKS